MSKKLFILISFVLVLAIVCNAGAQGTGTIMYEIWSDIGGTEMEDLTGNADFPDNPTSGELLTLFETPTDIADNFGGRIYGWLHPATSGDYTFWIATDDDGDLLLSTDDDPANAVVICGVDGWAPSRAFDGEAGAPREDGDEHVDVGATGARSDAVLLVLADLALEEDLGVEDVGAPDQLGVVAEVLLGLHVDGAAHGAAVLHAVAAGQVVDGVDELR